LIWILKLGQFSSQFVFSNQQSALKVRLETIRMQLVEGTASTDRCHPERSEGPMHFAAV
jgi:hypothetical protein